MSLHLQLGGFAFIGEGIPIGLGAAFRCKYMKVRLLDQQNPCYQTPYVRP